MQELSFLLEALRLSLGDDVVECLELVAVGGRGGVFDGLPAFDLEKGPLHTIITPDITSILSFVMTDISAPGRSADFPTRLGTES